MTRLKYLLVIALLLSGVAAALRAFAPPMSEWPVLVSGTFLIAVLTVFAVTNQKWTVLAAIFLLLAVSTVGGRWRYFLIGVVPAIWLAMHLSDDHPNIADWSVWLFKACWIALLLLAVVPPFLRRWREWAVILLVLAFTFDLSVLQSDRGVLPDRWLQRTGFRMYAWYLVRVVRQDPILSNCKLIDYVEEDGAKQQVGNCNGSEGSSLWPAISVIYDSSAQFSWPKTSIGCWCQQESLMMFSMIQSRSY
jgi:hypothetical protein